MILWTQTQYISKMTKLLTSIAFYASPSSFTPSVTHPSKSVTLTGHITVLATLEYTVFSIKTWLTF